MPPAPTAAFERARAAVAALVADIATHESRYLSPDYQEAEVRKDFIDKFFIALGWDVNHDTQKNPYEQEVILVSIYERFLGKVIVATPKQARVEEKPEVRQAGGVYYTPEYIVRYIVAHTVGKLITGKNPEAVAKLEELCPERDKHSAHRRLLDRKGISRRRRVAGRHGHTTWDGAGKNTRPQDCRRN